MSDLKYETSFSSSGEVYERAIKKVSQKGKVVEKLKGKKVVTQESDSPPKRLRRKNPTISFTHIPQLAAADDDKVESRYAEASSEEA